MSSNSAEICSMNALTIAKKVRDKELSPVEVADAIIDRLERIDPYIRAFCTPTPEVMRETAKRLERSVSRGQEIGPMAGVPIGVKDLIAMKGVKMEAGSLAYKGFMPEEDDVAVARLREADALLIGKTSVPELGFSGAGHNPVGETPRNPWNLDRTPGGSSAGGAAAVAAGIGPLGLCSDAAGSLRIPASFCGLVGVKASMGRVPIFPANRDQRFPGLNSMESLGHVGPIARTVADASFMLSVIAGPHPKDRHSIPDAEFDWMKVLEGGIDGLRVAYSEDWGYAAVDPEVRQIVGDAVEIFEDELGCHVEHAHPGWDDPYFAFWGLVASETDLEGMRELVDSHGDHMTPHVVEFVSRPWTAEELTSAAMTRKTLVNKMSRFMENYDLLLTPTLAVPAFGLHFQGPERIDGQIVAALQWLAFTFPINMTGQPAATITAGWTQDGLPVGLQIIGRHLDDPTVLRAAAAFESARSWPNRWPSVLEKVGD